MPGEEGKMLWAASRYFLVAWFTSICRHRNLECSRVPECPNEGCISTLFGCHSVSSLKIFHLQAKIKAMTWQTPATRYNEYPLNVLRPCINSCRSWTSLKATWHTFTTHSKAQDLEDRLSKGCENCHISQPDILSSSAMPCKKKSRSHCICPSLLDGLFKKINTHDSQDRQVLSQILSLKGGVTSSGPEDDVDVPDSIRGSQHHPQL